MKENPEFPKKIEKSNIEAIPPEIGGTEIILQRHEQYERDSDNPRRGSLTEKGVKGAEALGKGFFHKLLESLPEDERKKVSFLILASDTQYQNGGYRSMETASIISDTLKQELENQGLSEEQLLNISGNISGEGNPRVTEELREPQMLDNSPEFVEFLKNKYGNKNLDFWRAFEEDKEKETREKMGAEGPDDITDRIKFLIDVLARYSRFYHKKYPGRRLIIWAATHYDTISPYVKREIFGADKEALLSVDYGAGAAIYLDKDGKAKIKIGRNEYPVPLNKHSNRL